MQPSVVRRRGTLAARFCTAILHAVIVRWQCWEMARACARVSWACWECFAGEGRAFFLTTPDNVHWSWTTARNIPVSVGNNCVICILLFNCYKISNVWINDCSLGLYKGSRCCYAKRIFFLQQIIIYHNFYVSKSVSLFLLWCHK